MFRVRISELIVEFNEVEKLTKIQCFGDLLIKSANSFPDKIALIENEKKITYKDLLTKVDQLQKWICSLNLNENTIIAIFLPNSIEYVTAYFSISMSGFTILPIYSKLTKSEISNILEFSGVEIVITSKQGAKKIPDDYKVFLTEEYNELALSSEVILNNKKSLNEVALLLQTSGTTSKPKLVSHSFTSIVSNMKKHIESLNLTEEDKVLITLPMPFGYCNTSQFLTHIYLGGTLVLTDQFIHPKKLLNTISKNRITVFTAVPTILNTFELIDNELINRYDLSPLRMICFGGGQVSKNSILKVKSLFTNIVLVQTYGQTEAGPRITSKILSDDYQVTNVGKPLRDIEVLIKNENNDELPTNSTGDVWIKSDCVMLGYFKNQSETRKVIFNNQLYTGDYGYLDENQDLHILGRKGNMFKVGGLQVIPEEIEDFIRENFEIYNVIVKGEPHKILGNIPVAYVVNTTNLNSSDLKNEILNKCMNRFSRHKVPKEIIITNSIPATINGKLKRG